MFLKYVSISQFAGQVRAQLVRISSLILSLKCLRVHDWLMAHGSALHMTIHLNLNLNVGRRLDTIILSSASLNDPLEYSQRLSRMFKLLKMDFASNLKMVIAV